MGETAGEMSRPGQGGGEGQDRETAPTYTSGGESGTAELRAAIEETRAELSETVNAIQAQLSPEHLKDQVKEHAREATVGRVQQVATRARETATRAQEVTVGRTHAAVSRARETATRVGETAAGTAEQVVSQARERAQAVVQRAPETATGTGSTIVERIKQHPLPVAATALVFGGLMIWLGMRKTQGARASSS